MINVNGKKLSPRRLKLFGYKKNNVFIARGCSISSEMSVSFGTRINGKMTAKGKGSIKIGRYCAIGDQVRLITQNHSIDEQLLSIQLQREVYGYANIRSSDIDIGHNVWIGDAVIILPGIKVGSGAVIGAGSVVTKDVKEYEVVAGNPSRVIKNRFKDSFKLTEQDWLSSPEVIAKLVTGKNSKVN